MFCHSCPAALRSLTDVSVWLRGNGLEIVLFVTGAVLLTRCATWLSSRLTARIDRLAGEQDAVLRSEAAKHKHAVTQVVTWTLLVLVYCLTGVLVAERLGLPLSGFVAPTTVVGVALGFGAQRIVQDVLAGFFMVAERQYRMVARTQPGKQFQVGRALRVRVTMALLRAGISVPANVDAAEPTAVSAG